MPAAQPQMMMQNQNTGGTPNPDYDLLGSRTLPTGAAAAGGSPRNAAGGQGMFAPQSPLSMGKDNSVNFGKSASVGNNLGAAPSGGDS